MCIYNYAIGGLKGQNGKHLFNEKGIYLMPILCSPIKAGDCTCKCNSFADILNNAIMTKLWIQK